MMINPDILVSLTNFGNALLSTFRQFKDSAFLVYCFNAYATLHQLVYSCVANIVIFIYRHYDLAHLLTSYSAPPPAIVEPECHKLCQWMCPEVVPEPRPDFVMNYTDYQGITDFVVNASFKTALLVPFISRYFRMDKIKSAISATELYRVFAFSTDFIVCVLVGANVCVVIISFIVFAVNEGRTGSKAIMRQLGDAFECLANGEAPGQAVEILVPSRYGIKSGELTFYLVKAPAQAPIRREGGNI